MGTYGRGGGSRSSRPEPDEEAVEGVYSRQDPVERAMLRVQTNSQKIMTRAKEMQQLRMMREAKHIDYSMKQLKEIAARESSVFKSRLHDARARHADDIGLMKERHRQELQQPARFATTNPFCFFRQELQQLEQEFKEQVRVLRGAASAACDGRCRCCSWRRSTRHPCCRIRRSRRRPCSRTGLAGTAKAAQAMVALMLHRSELASHTSHITRYTSHHHTSHVTRAQQHRTPLHTGDCSLMQHLLDEGAAAAGATPLLFAPADGALNVTAAATPSILKHSPSPLPVGRAWGAGSVTLREAGAGAAAEWRGRGYAARDVQRGVRVAQVGCGSCDARRAGAHCAIAD
jgi:hypothetical protein